MNMQARNYLDGVGEPEVKPVDGSPAGALGRVSKIARHYLSDLKSGPEYLSRQLLGFVMHLSYDDVHIVTCDPWKRKCGGVPRGSFVLLRLAKHRVSPDEAAACDRLVMVRVTDSVPTPVAAEMQQTIFQIHKQQANLDPITNKEFQWSALKGSIVGTYYDQLGREGAEEGRIGFGMDVDTFFSAHCYEVFVPRSDHLQDLLNAFSEDPKPMTFGALRYTETPSTGEVDKVRVDVDPSDFIGKSYGHRTGLFGKTRFGKSNTLKVIADTVLRRNGAGQIIFDPSGEYTYWNEQDDGCLAANHPDKCVRYSLQPRSEEGGKGEMSTPSKLMVNFFDAPEVGHNLIFSLWESEGLGKVPDYISPARTWEVPAKAPDSTDASPFNHYWRTMGIWFAILVEAGFEQTPGKKYPVILTAQVKAKLMDDAAVRLVLSVDSDGKFSTYQPLTSFPKIWRKIEKLTAEKGLFAPSKTTGEDYFNSTEIGLMKILAADETRSGSRKFTRFKRYHHKDGSNVFEDIVRHAQDGKTVLVDVSIGDETVRKALGHQITSSLLRSQMQKFSQNDLGGKFIVVYFEEAHNFFPKSDKEVGGDVYNKLAKEGAKFNISMVYATQSMSTMSPDLLKNTENLIVTHLDDDREVKELEHKRAFRDVAQDVERIRSKGYVRMVTMSLPFALPVQVRRFGQKPTKRS